MSADLPLIGRDRVLVDKLVKELKSAARHSTRGPYETRRGGTFDVQLTDDNDVPTGHIVKVTVELTEFVHDPGNAR